MQRVKHKDLTPNKDKGKGGQGSKAEVLDPHPTRRGKRECRYPRLNPTYKRGLQEKWQVVVDGICSSVIGDVV